MDGLAIRPAVLGTVAAGAAASANFEGFDGEGTTYSAQGLAAGHLTPGASVTAGGLTFT